MVVVACFFAFGIVCAVAAWFVVREAAERAIEPRPPTYSMDEAYGWVERNLDELVASTLTPAEVRSILQYQIDFFGRQGVTQNGSTPHLASDVVISTSETVAYVIDRGAADGLTFIPEQIFPVVETQLAYLRAIGAVGLVHSVDDPIASSAMSKPTALEHFRFVGDKRTQIVYDMDDLATNDAVAAAVAEIVAHETFACFGPDTLDEARNRGYRPFKG